MQARPIITRALPTSPFRCASLSASRLNASPSQLWTLLRAALPRMSATAPYADTKWWDSNTVAVVTGTNKGIGFEIGRELRQQGLTVVLTARNSEAGLAAKEQIAGAEGAGKLLFHTLDISQPSSVNEFAAWLKQEFPGGIDILVNNAGFAYKGDTFGADEAQVTLDTNFYGTLDLIEALKPMVKDGTGRIVNVSSRAGRTSIVPSKQLLSTIESAPTTEELRQLGAKYGISKLLLTMATCVVAKELEPRGIMVNACCPGWCQTDMSSGGGPNTALQGADTPVWLALRPPSEFVSGKLFGERSAVPF